MNARPSSSRVAPSRAVPSRVVLGVALAFTVLVGLYVLVLRPGTSDLSSARSERDAVAEELAALEAAATAAATPTSDPAATVLGVAVPDSAELSNVLRQLTQLAADTGLAYRTLTPAPPVAVGAGGSAVTVTINASGTRAAALDYVQRLSTLERVFVIDKVSVSESTIDDPGVAQDVVAGGADLDVVGRVFTTAGGVAPVSG